MKVDPNQAKIVTLTNYEILLIILLLKKVVPNKEDQLVVWNIVAKLERIVGS